MTEKIDVEAPTEPAPTAKEPTNADVLNAVRSLRADLIPMKDAIRDMVDEVAAIRARVFDDYQNELSRLEHRMTSLEDRVTELEAKAKGAT
jgi:hypothetical protein